MEYSALAGSSDRFVKFFVFSNGQSSGQLINSANLDGFGEKFVPNLCTNCHGGETYSSGSDVKLRPANGAIGASFREFDTDSFKYPGGAVSLPTALRQNFYELNQLVLASNPQPAIADLIKNWDTGQPTDPPNTGYVPQAWLQAQKKQLYQDVVAKSCRTCHVAFNNGSPQSGINWTTFSQFSSKKGVIQIYTCGDSKYMPHALMTYRNFWLSLAPHRPDVLASELGLAGGCK
jgi:hypothetical protein